MARDFCFLFYTSVVSFSILKRDHHVLFVFFLLSLLLPHIYFFLIRFLVVRPFRFFFTSLRSSCSFFLSSLSSPSALFFFSLFAFLLFLRAEGLSAGSKVRPSRKCGRG